MIKSFMRIESFTRAKQQIQNFFLENKQLAYTSNDLFDIFFEFKEQWKIAEYRRPDDFYNFIEKQEILILDNLVDSRGTKKRIWKKENTNNFDVGLTIKKEGYLSNYSATQILGLTLQIPKTTYITIDKSENRYITRDTLEQKAVDRAFSKPQRVTSDSYKSQMDGYRYTFLQKKNNSINVGVKSESNIRYTNLERTLIDIAVRPSYSGGVFEVASAYNAAKESGLDLVKLESYLTELDYLYPYHQLIGFYLEKAGFEKEELKMFSLKITKINFYLTYNMNTKEYDSFWKIFFPKGF